jgi:predicted ATP-dependent endonuclease of OLD family
METLKIKNFLCIEEAEIEIKKINLFIGSQAQGKSVIAKLIYFFKEYPHSLVESVYRGISTKEGSDALVLTKFEKIFPRYTWENSDFKIEYSTKYYSVSISSHSGKLDLNSDFIFRETLETLKDAKHAHPDLINYKFNINDPQIFKGRKSKLTTLISESLSLLEMVLIDCLFNENENLYLEKNIYIPAGRSFFATLGNNLYYFYNSDIKIDYFLGVFGQTYLKIKTEKSHCEKNKKKRLDFLVEQIIDGQGLFEEEQDWIVNKRGKINLADASSGQQEALPIVTILLKNPYATQSYTANHFIIEEPEAHLFPTAQAQIVYLIANAYNATNRYSGNDFFKCNYFTIATHSPYILTAFNNLIQAGNVAASKNYQNLEELYKVVPKDEIVDFNDVSAYLVNNGTVQSILDNDLKLIDATMIDSVSRQFSNTFEQLVIMENECD